MAIKVDIPNSLVSELWSWYLPRAGSTPAGHVTQLGQCHDSKRNKVSYNESYKSLRALKDLRRAVCSLRHVIDEGVQKMEKELLPVSRHNGIRTLPSEIMVKIMSFVGNQPDMSPKSFKSLMHMFLKTPPFNLYLPDAKALIARWEHSEKGYLEGCLPPEEQVGFRADITKFHFSATNNYTLADIQAGLKPLKGLEELSITCSFDDNKISKGPDIIATVLLPRLRTLFVSTRAHYWRWSWMKTKSDGWESWRALRRVVRMLDMPSLDRIRADLRTTEYSWNGSLQLRILDELFSFPDLEYPNVTSLELGAVECGNYTAHSYVNLSAAFCSFPALEMLVLGSCDVVGYKFSWGSSIPKLRCLKLRFNGVLSPDWTCFIMSGEGLEGWLPNCKTLESIDVITGYDEVFDCVKAMSAIARRVSDESILDRNRTKWSDNR